jgi:hypothetical protein
MHGMTRELRAVVAFAVLWATPQAASAQAIPGARAGTDNSWAQDPPNLAILVGYAHQESELRGAVTAYSTGRTAMRRTLQGLSPAAAREKEQAWYRAWLAELDALDFDALGIEGRVDYVLLRNRVSLDLEGEPPGGGRGPIGRDALLVHLRRDWISYTPEELLALAEKEFTWMEAAMVDASRRMGFGDDWRAAQEKVKQSAVPPGQRPGLIRDIAYDSEAWFAERGIVTLPPLLREGWRMNMRGPESQLTNPFFTGGNMTITVSYPTADMTHDFKLQSMRGNNPHFDRATVHHELNPGHGQQGFMASRFNPHRQLFTTPEWSEGMSLYFEFVLWDKGFPRGPEDEIGMLTWRMHRAARIVFSLSYHLGLMTEQEAIDYVVRRVGWDRSNAEGEVRRSLRDAPLYQAEYMLGGLQYWALRKEFVDTGRMTEREFHDTLLQGGRMPVEAVRLRLTGDFDRNYTTRWRFYGDPLAAPGGER